MRLTSLPVAAGKVKTGTTKLDTFIISEKAALLQIGGYLPIYRKSWVWKHQGEENALFIAPIAKGGIQTITSREVSAEAKIFQDDDLFNFFAFGVRLGHYKFPQEGSRRNVAPALISYLDITIGKWENFEVIVPQVDPVTGQLVMDPTTMSPVMVRDRRLRYAFEGRLKVPGAPFQIGFDANAGKGKDDVRFLFGTSFDIGELIGRLGGVQSVEK